MQGLIVAVSRSPRHEFSKAVLPEIRLLAGLGVEGDAHAGVTVRHRYRVRKDPSAPNLCQVHLLHSELFAELATAGIAVAPGEMGENVTTRGVDLLGLPLRTRLHLGATAVVEVTGLRDPCAQLNALHPRLMQACIGRAANGTKVRKAGIMSIVLAAGVLRAGDAVSVEWPQGEFVALGPV